MRAALEEHLREGTLKWDTQQQSQGSSDARREQFFHANGGDGETEEHPTDEAVAHPLTAAQDQAGDGESGRE